MAMAELNYESKNTARTEDVAFVPGAATPLKGMYHCHVGVIREDDGSFSVVVLNLPGAGSCGRTEEEALQNAREAIAGTIASYRESGEPIPWCGLTQYDIPEGANQRWILVDG
jgi:predicted RNase H-like HicB family nuclease